MSCPTDKLGWIKMNFHYSRKGLKVEEKNLIVSDNETVNGITDRNGLAKGYITFEDTFGSIFVQLSESECTDEINSIDYFDIMREYDFIVRGKYSKNSGLEVTSAPRSSRTEYTKAKWYPPQKAMIDYESDGEDYQKLDGGYMSKRGSFGFDLTSDEYENKIKKIIIKELCELNKRRIDALEERMEIIWEKEGAITDAKEQGREIPKMALAVTASKEQYLNIATKKYYRDLCKRLGKKCEECKNCK